MTIEQILELGKMGYTKDEISAMQESKQEPKQEPKEESKEEPKKEPKEEPKKDPDNNSKFLEDLQKTLNGFITDLQKQNIVNSNNKDNSNKQTSEEILASIIAPPLKRKE